MPSSSDDGYPFRPPRGMRGVSTVTPSTSRVAIRAGATLYLPIATCELCYRLQLPGAAAFCDDLIKDSPTYADLYQESFTWQPGTAGK